MRAGPGFRDFVNDASSLPLPVDVRLADALSQKKAQVARFLLVAACFRISRFMECDTTVGEWMVPAMRLGWAFVCIVRAEHALPGYIRDCRIR